MITKKQVRCAICKQPTSLYRLEYGENKEKRYICSKHPKEKQQMKVEGIAEKDEIFFKYVWDNSDHHCAECGMELKEFSRYWIHHILAKARYKYFRWDIRNTIILCYKHHNEIESAISAPKLKVFPYCESIKKELLQSINIEYSPQ